MASHFFSLSATTTLPTEHAVIMGFLKTAQKDFLATFRDKDFRERTRGDQAQEGARDRRQRDGPPGPRLLCPLALSSPLCMPTRSPLRHTATSRSQPGLNSPTCHTTMDYEKNNRLATSRPLHHTATRSRSARRDREARARGSALSLLLRRHPDRHRSLPVLHVNPGPPRVATA